ncbi:MAG TPA: hypothetical protein PL024_12360 [Thauera sp.]|nr:hypothetical protein [Thauera sp.]HRA82282.1 hypothetical protein [Thauera sp.]
MHTITTGTPAHTLTQAASSVVGIFDSGLLTIHVDDDMADAELVAHARLLAAAPELHQACADAEALLTRQKWIPSTSTPEGGVLAALRAALAKAQGGAA